MDYAALGFAPRDVALNSLGRPRMAWKAPKIVEVPVGMEIKATKIEISGSRFEA
jgi:coenzyme PQQ precursor peptide PqqA